MADEAVLVELVEAFGIPLRPADAGLVGVCPRCGGSLELDGEHWSCGCGSGGPVELVAIFGGLSMSHAAELVRSGWRPDGPPGLVAKSTVRPLPLLCDPDSDDEAVIDAVLAHYQGERRSSEQAKGWLAERGVDDALADELRIGFANRTLGYRLPEANRRDGAKLRDQLMRLGIYRTSGHEHFRGCVVIPVLSADGRVLQLCGLRLATASVEPQWAAGLPGGMLNEAAVATSREVIVVASVDDALAVIGAGHRAVLAPGRAGGFHTADLRLLARGGVQRCTIIGDGLARDLCLTGRRIDAQEAHRIGLVSSVNEVSLLRERAIQLAECILEAPPDTLRFVKGVFKESSGKGFEESFLHEHDRAFREILFRKMVPE